MRVYIDSMLLIYVIEQHPTFAPVVEAWLTANPCDLVSNELGRMECLIVPVRNNDAALVAEFEDCFQNRIAELVPLTRVVFDRAVQIRAATKIKLPMPCIWHPRSNPVATAS